jgi:hypothetical protein
MIAVVIDTLDAISRRYGPQWADTVMQSLASITQSSVRSGDLVARLASNELGVFLPGATIENAQDVGMRIRRRCDRQPSAPATHRCRLNIRARRRRVRRPYRLQPHPPAGRRNGDGARRHRRGRGRADLETAGCLRAGGFKKVDFVRGADGGSFVRSHSGSIRRSWRCRAPATRSLCARFVPRTRCSQKPECTRFRDEGRQRDIHASKYHVVSVRKRL